MIDYRNLSEASEGDFEEMYQLYAKVFLLWKTKTSLRRSQSLDRAYDVWWLLKGPTDFKNTVDAARFKAAVLAVAAANPLETPTEPTPEPGA